VTITTDANTKVFVNWHVGTPADLAAGQTFFALMNGSPGDSIQTLVSQPARMIFAKTPRQIYGFVGTVTAVDPTGGTVTVDVARSLPSSLVPAGSPPVPFTVGPHTLVLGGSGSGGLGGGFFGGLFGGSLSNVSVGDMVAGGLIAPGGQTLTQIEATPLMVLLDLPARPTTSAAAAARAQSRALHKAVSLVKHGAKKHKSHKKSHKKASKRTHSRAGKH
jgi:hypothetical protein